MTTRREPRWWFVAYTAALGGVLAAAALLGGQPTWFAGFAVALMVGVGIAMANTPYGRLRAASQDEREQSIDLKAVAVTGGVLTVVIIAAFLVDVAQGGDGMPWVWLGALAGGTYLVALVVLNLRR